MPGSTNSLLEEATRLVHELATQQGLAYRTYGDALQRFGDSQMAWSELFKTSGDIYLKESVRTVWSLIRANANACAWMMSMAGAKPLHPTTDSGKVEAPSGKRAQRGRD